MNRVSETELILPALYIMSISRNGSVSTNSLITKLRDVMQPTGEDLDIIQRRKDDKFSQKVRNLKSNRPLEKHKYATHTPRGFAITDKGMSYLEDNSSFIRYLFNNNFGYNDVVIALKNQAANSTKKIELFDENSILFEGNPTYQKTKKYQRSNKLREAAINHFTEDGNIVCDCCNFSFEVKYGEMGKGYIEIHHIKPICKYDNEEIQKVISEALKNLAPLCSNCHRMIHRGNKGMLVSDLKKRIR